MHKPEKAKPRIQNFIPFAIFLLVGLASGYFMGRTLVDFSDQLQGLPEPLVLVILLIIFFSALYFQLILHETGHLVFGLVSGYRFSSFRIGSLMLLKDGNHLRLKTLSILGTGGQCLMLPPQWRDERFPFTLYLLGGVLMNFISSGLFALLYPLTISGSAVSVLLGALALTGLAIGLMNAIPLHLAMLDNDGYTVRLMRKDPQAVFAYYRMMQIIGQIANGFRLKEMPEEWFLTPASADVKNSLIATIEVYRCNRLLDEQKIEETAKSIRTLIASEAAIAGIHRNLLICDLVYCSLMVGDIEEVNRLLDEQQQNFMRSMKRFPGVLRTQYTTALLRDHNAADAAMLQTKFDRMAQRYPYSSDIASERELMCAARMLSESE